MFAVFILKNNAWTMHWNVGNDRAAGLAEIKYLTGCGITAKLFTKEASK